MTTRREISITQRILGAVDMTIDFATLGEYGLQTLAAEAGSRTDGQCRGRLGQTAGREASATARRRGCRHGRIVAPGARLCERG